MAAIQDHAAIHVLPQRGAHDQSQHQCKQPFIVFHWTNVHVNYCPHGVAYFLAWHRDYLYHFEQQLRTVSGDSALTLPYWNYYRYPKLPAEFTDPADKPLYVQRTATNVYNALTPGAVRIARLESPAWNHQCIRAAVQIGSAQPGA